MIEIGYFGVPGTTWATKTHITDNRKAICGAAIRRAAEFQMCANGAAHLRLVECERCKAKWARRASTRSKP